MSIGSPNRINGLFSGMDTGALVRNMLQYEQAKVNRQFQLKTSLEWKRDAYRDINVSLRKFREDFMSVLNPDKNVFTASAYSVYKVNMLSETNAVSISAGSNATEGKLTINKIEQLATKAKVESDSIFREVPLSYEILLSDSDAFNNPLDFSEGEIKFEINGEEFTISEDETLASFINKINNSKANVKVSYSSLTGRLNFVSTGTGESAKIEIVNISGNAFGGKTGEGENDVDKSFFGIVADTYTGDNAIVTIENVQVVRESNTFTIDGITYTLKDETNDPVSFNVERDIDTTFEKIIGFIEAYNDLIGTLQGTLEEKINYGYSPLTDDQRAEMTEKEIALWEDHAKSGLLRNDANISSLLTKMRSAFFAEVKEFGVSPAEIGLTTGAWYDKGKIVVDETVLRRALEENPDLVTSVFVNVSSASNIEEKFNNSGLVVRISDAMTEYTKKVTSASLPSLDRNINEASDRLRALERMMDEAESKYYRDISRMEMALAGRNSQSSWLAAQMSGLSF